MNAREIEWVEDYDLQDEPMGLEEGLIKPDVVDDVGKKVGESKACCVGHSLNLFDGQILRYKDIQISKQDSEIYFAIYRHNQHGIKSFKGSKRELFESLADKTYFSLRLPFSIILALHSLDDNTKIRKYSGEKFPHCSILLSKTLNRLFSEPARVLEDFNLDSKDYIFSRKLSPMDFKIEGHQIRQFPILHISDRNRGKWIKNFVADNYNSANDGCNDNYDEEDKVNNKIGNPNQVFTLSENEDVPF